MNSRSLIVPSAGWPVIRQAARLALSGALIAGLYGIIHDQVTFTISPEYFTRMKFDQFRGADFGLPPRIFVAEIGFLATWWVGLIAGWFLARIAVPKFHTPGRRVVRAMVAIIGITLLSGLFGAAVGPGWFQSDAGWRQSLLALGVTDATAFERVAGIHLGNYAGALVGWIVMMLRLARTDGDLI